MERRQWFDVHSWVGLKLSLLMSFVLITGTLATVSKELDWLSNAAMRVDSHTPISDYDWAAMYEQAQSAYPEAQLARMLAPIEPWFALEVTALDASGKRFRIFIDPDTREVTGTGRWFNWQRFFRQAHRHLMMPVTIGLTIVCLLSFLLLTSLVSSIIIYRHWWKGFFQWPQGTANKQQQTKNGKYKIGHTRRWWSELHKLAGVWSLWFVLLIGLTGTWYLLERWGLAARYPTIKSSSAETPPTSVTAAQLNNMITSVRSLYPQLEIQEINLPNNKHGLVSVSGQADAILVRNRANRLVFDAATSEHIHTIRGDELNLHFRIAEAADPLHFGTFGNWIVRWLWFFFGALLSALSITGVYLSGLRLMKNRKTEPTAWQGMGHYRLPAIALVAFCLLVTPVVFLS